MNSDGWPDLVIANDTQPKLYVNNKGASESACRPHRLQRRRRAQASMPPLRSHRQAQHRDRRRQPGAQTYHNDNGLFVDEAPRSEIGRRGLLTWDFALFLVRQRWMALTSS